MLIWASLTLHFMSISRLITSNFTDFDLEFIRGYRFALLSHGGKKSQCCWRGNCKRRDYITNITCAYMWLMVWQVFSFFASLLHKISAAPCCLCQIVLNTKLLHKFESCVNFCVEAEQHKGKCVKWDLSVISATICGCLCYPLLCNYRTRTTKKTKTTITTTNSTIITTSKFIPVHTVPIHVRSTDLVPLILNLGCKWGCLVKITSRTLHPFESTPVPIILKTGWAPEPGWILQRE